MEPNENNWMNFHPLIARWFTENVGTPTEVQMAAWPRIYAGDHVLVTAPTGSGKTLTAFLWAINQLVASAWEVGHTRVLYISPLKALNNDIYRNLLKPLDELRNVFVEAKERFPLIHVQTRSGDTPQEERRRMLRVPPEILITTPESLNLLLSSRSGRTLLTHLSTVILDEVHAVIGNKRGVHLMTAVERLTRLSGEFQRIALSATIKPLETVARFVGGYRITGTEKNPAYTPRPVTTIRSETTKEYRVSVRFPQEAVDRRTDESLWDALAVEFKRIVGTNRSTLLFVNNRRLTEKLTLKINEGEESPVAYAHHGSLSREIRAAVEHKLKRGELQAIVATNSLEMGIDIGALDEVLLIQSPPSISSAIQRVGRAGHQVGEKSRGTLFPTHAHDLLESAVLAVGIVQQDIEEIKPVRCPLDVLAQVIVSMVGVETWDIDALYANILASDPYHPLGREQFDLVLNMLAGRYAASRARELKPRISIDRLDNTVSAKKEALLALYLSGGTIPDRGYFHLRHLETNARIGELDEEFVWEASIGQTFALGSQHWRIERITHNDVLVLPGNSKALDIPFWKGEELNRDFHFSERIGLFLKKADEDLGKPELKQRLRQDHFMEETAAEELIGFLQSQRTMTHAPLPHRYHVLVELVESGPGAVPGNQVVIHTFWGGRVNRPFAMALDAAWEERNGQRLEIYAGNDCVILQLPEGAGGEELLSLVTAGTIEKLLRRRLEGSGYFGARFRECAGRALLLTRNRLSQRMPLWMSRLRSQKLLESVLKYTDFPILLEAWRTCLQDEFDMEHLHQVLIELESGAITWSQTRTHAPSPMAQNLTWRQINQYMYMSDEPSGDKQSRLRGDLLREVVFTPGLRPTIHAEMIRAFEEKRQRVSPGYSPGSARDLVDWVKERVLIPAGEWEELCAAIQRDHKEGEDVLKGAAGKLVWFRPPAATAPLIAALERVPELVGALYPPESNVTIDILSGERLREELSSGDEEERNNLLTMLVGEWLQYFGPTTTDFICTTLGVEQERLLPALEDLLDEQKLISGPLVTEGTAEELCDSENFEILLRLARKEAVPSFEPLPLEKLGLFLATQMGVARPAEEVDGVFAALGRLLCHPLPAHLWEGEVLPARVSRYTGRWLDAVIQETDLRWLGTGNERVAFCFEQDLDLLRRSVAKEEDAITELFSDRTARYHFSALLQSTAKTPSRLADALWEGVWEGRVTNDSYNALRKGIENNYEVPDVAHVERQRNRTRREFGRGAFAQRKETQPYTGNWFLLPQSDPTVDLLEQEERKKERVRLLLDRYGILFRELLYRELPELSWAQVFRSLRLMELSGEVMAGCFFHGVPGPQFISHQAFRVLQRKLPEEAIFWINATDPASLCGVRLEGLRGALPKRVDGTHLVYHGEKLTVVSKRQGKDLVIFAAPDDPYLAEYWGFGLHLLARDFMPLSRITIESINGDEAAHSPYLDVLRTLFDVVVDYKNVVVYKKH